VLSNPYHGRVLANDGANVASRTRVDDDDDDDMRPEDEVGPS
jgi:hypothetical protein